jgi:hypothetical protein
MRPIRQNAASGCVTCSNRGNTNTDYTYDLRKKSALRPEDLPVDLQPVADGAETPEPSDLAAQRAHVNARREWTTHAATPLTIKQVVLAFAVEFWIRLIVIGIISSSLKMPTCLASSRR